MTANILLFKMLLYMQKDYDRSWIWINFIRKSKKQKKEPVSDSGMQGGSIHDQTARQRSSKASNEIHNKTDEVLNKAYDKTKLHCRILGQKTQNENHDSLTRRSNIAEKNVSATIVTILAI